jgi:hypothetical protein
MFPAWDCPIRLLLFQIAILDPVKVEPVSSDEIFLLIHPLVLSAPLMHAYLLLSRNPGMQVAHLL